MTDDDLKVVLDMLATYEGRVPYMYQDNADQPNVTVGVGYLVHDAEAACALPFHHVSDGLPASRDEITHEFLRVHQMRGGLSARSYKGSLVLSPEAIDQEGFRRLRLFMARLPELFPAYESFPVPAQQRLLDLAWNNGLGAPATPNHRATGLYGWTHLIAACNSVPPDWIAASKTCTVANPNNLPARAARNAWRVQGFIEAAGTA